MSLSNQNIETLKHVHNTLARMCDRLESIDLTQEDKTTLSELHLVLRNLAGCSALVTMVMDDLKDLPF